MSWWVRRACSEGSRWMPPLTMSQQFGGSRSGVSLRSLLSPISTRNGSTRNLLQGTASFSSSYGNSGGEGDSISRSWIVKLWNEEKRKMNVRRTRKLGYFMTTEQSPVSQYDSVSVTPNSSDEVKLATLLARSNLIVTRDVEWANIMFSIEQESRYVIMDACDPQSPVGFIHEQSNLIFRQLLRTRRPFIAQIIDAMGNEIFRIRRPFWLINSSIYAEVDGKVVGVVHRRWHLWRRIYDLYLGNNQFAMVENPGFWNWTFTLKDEDDNVLAEIDRNWRGVGFELFTDAGMYAIRFGNSDSSQTGLAAAVVEEFEVVRPLTLAERAVTLALAVSLDSDYFSRRGGWGLPIFIAEE